MAEYIYDEVQTVQPNQAALLMDSIPCAKGYVLHNNGSGLITLRGIVNGPSCGCGIRYAQYKVGFETDISIPNTGSVGEISVGIAGNGEIIPVTIASATPTATEAWWHVSGQKTIKVPQGCCPTITIENNSDQAIEMRHLNVPISRIA